MRAIDLTLVLIALGAAAQAPQEPEPMAKPTAKAEDSASEIAARLRDKCEHQSCTVTYKMTRAGKERTLRICYSPPGGMTIGFRGDEGAMESWIQPDRWVVRSTEPNAIWSADFDPKELCACEIFGVLKDEFPWADVQGENMGPGARLAFRLHPDKPFDDDRYIKFEWSWSPERQHPLDWIARPEEWNDARVEEKLLVREYSSGARFTLSRDSGWPVEMSHPAGARLELIDYKDSVESDDFDVPSPTAGMKNSTQEFMQGTAPMVFFGQRSSVYAAGVRACLEKTFEKTVIDGKLVKVFTFLYAKDMHRGFGDWAEACDKGSEQFAEWCEKRLEQIGDDSTLRDEFDDLVRSQRAGFAKLIGDAIDGYVSKISTFEPQPNESGDENEPLDPRLVSEIFVSEKTAARQAFEAEIAAPMLAKLDAALRAIGAVK
ncbi:MAG: hypothetical protein ABI054_04045 [Planctomycetota bacterium]